MSHDERPDKLVQSKDSVSFRGVEFQIMDACGERWVMAKQIAVALGAKRRTLFKLIADMTAAGELLEGVHFKCIPLPTPGGEQETLILSHRGVVRITMRSNAPRAIPFRDFAETVLCAVMTTGHYEMPGYQQVSPSLDVKAIAEAVAQSLAQVIPQMIAGITDAMWGHSFERTSPPPILEQLVATTVELKNDIENKIIAVPEPDIRDWPTPTQRLRTIGTDLPPHFNGGGSFDEYASDEHERCFGNCLRRRDRRFRGKHSEPVIQPCAPEDVFLRKAFNEYMKFRWPKKQQRLRGM